MGANTKMETQNMNWYKKSSRGIEDESQRYEIAKLQKMELEYEEQQYWKNKEEKDNLIQQINNILQDLDNNKIKEILNTLK